MKSTARKKKDHSGLVSLNASPPASTLHPWPDPPHELDCITLGTGFFKPGIRCRLIGGEEVTVYLGPAMDPVKTKLPKFALKFWDEKNGQWREDRNGFPCHEYGKDFEFFKK